jgi:hypothetical protein
MTDARFPERWLHDLRFGDLESADEKWSYLTALVWSAANRTEGVILPKHLRLIPDFAAGAEDALVDAGLWTVLRNGGWLIVDFADTQTTKSDLDAADERRRKARDKKRRQREKSHDSLTSENGSVPGDVGGDVPRDVPQPITRPRPRNRTRTGLGGEPEVTNNVSGKTFDNRGIYDEDGVPYRYCSKHPEGTDDPCGWCRDARLRHDAWEEELSDDEFWERHNVDRDDPIAATPSINGANPWGEP